MTRGLIERQVSPHMRREVALTLSAPGRDLMAEYDRHRLDTLRAALGTFAPQRRQEILAALREFAAVIGHPARDDHSSYVI